MSPLVRIALAAVLALIGACSQPKDATDYKQRMRDFVHDLSVYAKAAHPGFLIIPQNGPEIMTVDGTETGVPDTAYLAAIDGAGREDLFYGYASDNEATPAEDRDYMLAFADLAERNGVQVLTTDYCSTPARMDQSYRLNAAHYFISFAADSRELDRIPTYPAAPCSVNANNIVTLADAKNFLYLISPDVVYASKAAFLSSIAATNYDLFIIDAFWGDSALTAADIAGLKTKANGGSRLVVAYLSIGEAENYRYYWQSGWKDNPPSWLAGENPNWPGNYKVRYWDPAWQAVIYGSADAYLDRILAAGYDGAYLDIIEAYEYFENDGKWWYPY
jgi:cysteinyl-tRNA synthetase, unknown class